MKPEIANIFGPALQQEVSALLENLTGMTDIIEANYSQIKDILQKHKDEMIMAITQKNEKEIAELKNDLKDENAEITNLKNKEVELIGKDEMIASLNNNIQNY
jgi:predicted RNase H-like nuclease (RuvC/YqgF family)